MIRDEIQAGRKVLKSLDRQTIVVLTVSAVLVLLQMKFGSRRLFRTDIAPILSLPASDLFAWGWWFVMQGTLGFVLPVLILKFGFSQTREQMGLGLGDWKFAGTIAALYVPVVLIGTWVLSDGPAFQQNYPHLQEAANSWQTFFVYESLFLFYWIGWEYLWRGFVLFGTRKSLGFYAIFVQALPFAVLHYAKPLPEALLSVVGGIVLGALVWRTGSFWIAVPIHWIQMFSLDLFSTLRIRSGISGYGLSALIDTIRSAF
jgi:CAAX protease family protein